ncbi:pyridoxamine 5'-phosphate oxidase family protein [Thermoactinospora rubra]|uniref:pyridoxamine 5'-phosphate oxidase family protein n=1 Tax=Thermoactinospora rubra TaxID=1088767 RepID=UPI000A11EDA4|nr:pyridoxamine 5'-phosphate oxidase family protein [Thermoactinospora rubra]
MTTIPDPIAELLFSPADATPMSSDEATVKPWEQARRCLAAARKVWLTTTRPDGRPHTAPVLLVWAGEDLCFATRPGSRKARNLQARPSCVVAASDETLDLVVEGAATLVREEAGQRRVAEALLAEYGWRLTLRDGSFHDDGLPGSPEYVFYRVTPTRAYGYGPDGLTATRWRFA